MGGGVGWQGAGALRRLSRALGRTGGADRDHLLKRQGDTGRPKEGQRRGGEGQSWGEGPKWGGGEYGRELVAAEAAARVAREAA